MANNYKRWLSEESLKTSSSRPTLIYFEFRSKPSLITVICMNLTRPTNLICCDKILFSHTQRGYQFLFLDYFIIIISFISGFFFGYFTFLLILTKIILLLLFYYIFFHENYFYFFMFRDVPGCSGMFRDVPCSWFYRRPNMCEAALQAAIKGRHFGAKLTHLCGF